MLKEDLVPTPPKDLQPVPETTDLQPTFERLLRQFVSQGGEQEVTLEAETLQDTEAGEIRQLMFISPGWTKKHLPNIGIALISNRGRAEYATSFHEPRGYGKVTVGEPHFTIKGQKRGVSGPQEIFGEFGRNLSDIYDTPIVQAAANVFGRKILHSLRVDLGDQERIKKLTRMGYQPRRGYLYVYDKFYEPQVASV